MSAVKRLASRHLVALALALGGCASLDGHRCAGAPDSCGAGGVCEADGLCSFVDSACPSGRAYGDEVAGGLAGQCTANPCGARTLLWRDEFDDATPGPRVRSDPASTGTTVEADGALAITVGASAGDGGDYDTVDLLDLRGGALIAEVAELPMVDRYFSTLSFYPAGHSAALWHTFTGEPRLVADLEDQARATRPWNGGDRFWRIAEANGTLSWAVSADGVMWTEMHATATPFDVSQVRGSVRSWSEGPGGTVRFASFTVCGP